MKYEATINLSNKNNSHTLAFEEILRHSHGRKLKILEVGCSTGYFGAALVELGHEVWGVEPHRGASQKAKDVLHKVHVGFVEDFFSRNEGVRFDVIIFGDVIEHLVDSVSVLKQSIKFLHFDGIVVASIPNVAHIAIRAMMLEGRWEYSDLGILDRTHLRFFTRTSLIDLFTESGYKVLNLESVRLSAEQVDEICKLGIRRESIRLAKENANDGRGYDFQYVLSAKPCDIYEDAVEENSIIKNEYGIRVLCLVSAPSSTIVDIRLRNPLTRWASMFGGYLKILSIYEFDSSDLLWSDVVVFQREAGQYVLNLVEQLQSRGKKIVFEIDDFLMRLPPFLSHHSEHIGNSLPYINKLIHSADAISVSTHELKLRLEPLSENIFVTPNYSEIINVCSTQSQVKPTDVKLIIASSDRVLVDMIIEPILFLQREFGFKVIAIGPPGDRLCAAGIKVEKYSNIGHHEFKRFVASVDNGIGVIPLDSSEFSRCKSAVKFFDYSTCGVPSICSNVLPYSAVVDNEVTGLLVDNTTEAWSFGLRALILSHDLRGRIARAAKERVIAEHNLMCSVRSWQSLFGSFDIPIQRSRDGGNSNLMLKSPRFSVASLFLCHFLKPSSYIKACIFIKKHGFRCFYERVSRR